MSHSWALVQHSTRATLESLYLQFGILSWSVFSAVSEPPTTCCQSSGTATFVSLYLSDHLHTLHVIYSAWSLSARTVLGVPSCLCWAVSIPDSLTNVVIQLLPVSLGPGILQITCALAPRRNFCYQNAISVQCQTVDINVFLFICFVLPSMYYTRVSHKEILAFAG